MGTIERQSAWLTPKTVLDKDRKRPQKHSGRRYRDIILHNRKTPWLERKIEEVIEEYQFEFKKRIKELDMLLG